MRAEIEKVAVAWAFKFDFTLFSMSYNFFGIMNFWILTPPLEITIHFFLGHPLGPEHSELTL